MVIGIHLQVERKNDPIFPDQGSCQQEPLSSVIESSADFALYVILSFNKPADQRCIFNIRPVYKNRSGGKGEPKLVCRVSAAIALGSAAFSNCLWNLADRICSEFERPNGSKWYRSYDGHMSI